MKKLQKVLFMVSVLCSVSFIGTSHACSIHLGEPNEMKDAIIPRLSSYLGVSSSLITRNSLTKPGVSFLNGLGADCTGLEAAVVTTAYNFTKRNGLSTCTYKGVVIIKGINVVDGELFVNTNGEPTCARTLIPRFPILPIPR